MKLYATTQKTPYEKPVEPGREGGHPGKKQEPGREGKVPGKEKETFPK